MAAPPTYHDWVLNENATSANLQSLTDSIDFLFKKPRCRVTRTVDKSIANNTLTLMDWDDEIDGFDPNGFHSTVTNNSRITPNVSGLYLVTVNIHWTANATGRRGLNIGKNGVVQHEQGIAAASASTTTNHTGKLIQLNGTTDYVECSVIQNSGGALNVETALHASWFEVVWFALDETTAF